MPEPSEDEHSAITPGDPPDFPGNEAIPGCLHVIRLNLRRFNASFRPDKLTFALYSISDSLSSTNSTLRFLVEVSCPEYVGSAAMLAGIHKLMRTPETLALIIGEGLFLVTYSFLASYFQDKDSTKEDPVKIFIMNSWPYFRDFLKGMKNGYRGLKTTLQIVTNLSGANVKMLVIPLGLAIGVLASANRFLIGYLNNIRDKKQKNNDINKLIPIDRNSYDRAIETIEWLNKKQRVLGYLSMGMGGLIDGVYLYAGLVALAALTSVLYTVAAAFSAFYVVTCIVSRLYEEYEKQVKCDLSSLKLECELTKKYIEGQYTEIVALLNNTAFSNLESRKIDLAFLILEINLLITGLEKNHEKIVRKSKNSYLTAVLFGFRQGLFTYGVLACFLFMVTSIFVISSAAFPPALLLTCIISGVGFIAAIIAHSVRTHYQHTKNQEAKNCELQAQNSWDDIKEYFKQLSDVQDSQYPLPLKTAVELKHHLMQGSKVPESPQFIFQKWLEMIRSFFTGISKGNSFSTIFIMPFQVFENGLPPSRSTWMNIFALINMVVFASILALRALFREFKQLIKVKETNSQKVPDNDGTYDAELVRANQSLAQTPKNSRVAGFRFLTPAQSKKTPPKSAPGFSCIASPKAEASAAHLKSYSIFQAHKSCDREAPVIQEQLMPQQMYTTAGSM